MSLLEHTQSVPHDLSQRMASGSPEALEAAWARNQQSFNHTMALFPQFIKQNHGFPPSRPGSQSYQNCFPKHVLGIK